jgi:hypothetical protein
LEKDVQSPNEIMACPSRPDAAKLLLRLKRDGGMILRF